MLMQFPELTENQERLAMMALIVIMAILLIAFGVKLFDQVNSPERHLMEQGGLSKHITDFKSQMN
jgi:hypothetical protein